MNDDSSKARGIVAAMVTLGLIALTVVLIFTSPTSQALTILTGLVGALTTAFGVIISFYFGSSAGAKALSAKQGETVDKLATAVATSIPTGVDIPIPITTR